jgi:phosphoglycerate kinase
LAEKPTLGIRHLRTLDDLQGIGGRRVFVRVDFNVPMKDGIVTDDTRLWASVPTVTELADRGAIVLLLSHLGRPDGVPVPELSLALLARPYARILGRPVRFIEDIVGDFAAAAIAEMGPGEIALLENMRFHSGEEKNDPKLAVELAALGDFYVDDAFSAAHRAHVSTEGLAHLLPAFAGRAMEAELSALEQALGQPKRPLLAVVGGAKVSTKLEVLRNLVRKVDHLVLGGGMANTFLAARGMNVGRSMAEHALEASAREVLVAADRAGCTVHLPSDVVVAKELAADPPSMRTSPAAGVADDEMILDVGPNSMETLLALLKASRTLIWNGPLGAFEIRPFDKATMALAEAAAALTKEGALLSVAGGGDTAAAIRLAGVTGDLTFVSTAGGAFLEWMEGRELPGVRALEMAAAEQATTQRPGVSNPAIERSGP